MVYTFGVVTIFPEMLSAVTEYGVVGRAFRDQRCRLCSVNPRDYTQDAHRTVDDLPYGGGPGMVMKPEPLMAALNALKQQPALVQAPVLYLSPQGRPVDQLRVDEWASASGLILLSGRYEGIDERVIALGVDAEVSVGDFVVSGGELPAMMLMDAIARRLPGVLGDETSSTQDSFVAGRLDWPHYTRPFQYAGLSVPDVLRSGHHERIQAWRHRQACERTVARRPDLLERWPLSTKEQAFLQDGYRDGKSDNPLLKTKG
ncbi:MAG: tRNA (guanosine(37)-N1)-methyltransferase TrmD [Gammaproteobacteria bacterium]